MKYDLKDKYGTPATFWFGVGTHSLFGRPTVLADGSTTVTPPTPTGVAAPQAGTEKRFMLAGGGGVVEW